ncbi:MAG: hypothetical protein U9Q83_10725, partial [Bacteroidota bacterium]|nr:hypothetical protein [Bacteroidota bacterium]
MKNLVILLSVFFIFGCSNNDKKDSDNNKKDETNKVDSFEDKIDDVKKDFTACDQFLDDYEVWIDEAIVIIKDAKA